MADILIPDRIWVEDNTVYASGSLDSKRSLIGATLKSGVVDAFGTIINPHAFDEWLYKVTPPKLGGDSAMEVGLNDH